MLYKVAVYGSLRAGLGNHCVMEQARGKSLGSTVTTFPANLRDYGSFPYVHTESVQPASPVLVELYEVDERGLEVLDCLEGYPNFYDRSEFEFSDGTKAWMYHINNESHDNFDLVESGDWVKHVGVR
jgi:gamma-glutamylaminecyclotransferase